MPITNKGKYIYPNGDIYTGYFKDGKKNGFGNIKLIDGTSIKGFFSNNILSGQVKIQYLNGNEYKGFVEHYISKKNNIIILSGYGVYKYKNGDKYEGNFQDDTFCGKGIVLLHTGINIEGIFNVESDIKVYINNAKMYYPDGNIFEGKILNLSPYNGIMKYSNGNIFLGDFRNNYQYFGLMLYKNKDIYRGYFKDNLKSGQGLLLKFVNGYQEIYEGIFNLNEYITPYIKSIVSCQNYDDMNHNIPYLVGEEMYEYILKNKMV